MPGFDQTGPQGNGPMTGGARGLCRQAENGGRRGRGPAATGNKMGKGQGRGNGLRCGMQNRFGRRNMFGPSQPLPSDEK